MYCFRLNRGDHLHADEQRVIDKDAVGLPIGDSNVTTFLGARALGMILRVSASFNMVVFLKSNVSELFNPIKR